MLPFTDDDPAVALASELRRREVVLAAVVEQVETVMRLVGGAANDPQWRGVAARAFAAAVDSRLHVLMTARRSLDVAGGSLAWARHDAEQRALAAAAATGGARG